MFQSIQWGIIWGTFLVFLGVPCLSHSQPSTGIYGASAIILVLEKFVENNRNTPDFSESYDEFMCLKSAAKKAMDRIFENERSILKHNRIEAYRYKNPERELRLLLPKIQVYLNPKFIQEIIDDRVSCPETIETLKRRGYLEVQEILAAKQELEILEAYMFKKRSAAEVYGMFYVDPSSNDYHHIIQSQIQEINTEMTETNGPRMEWLNKASSLLADAAAKIATSQCQTEFLEATQEFIESQRQYGFMEPIYDEIGINGHQHPSCVDMRNKMMDSPHFRYFFK